MNPFPCGWLNDLQIACGCRQLSLPNIRNESRVHCLIESTFTSNVPPVDYEKLSSDRMGETSELIRKRVQAARNVQQQRFASSQSYMRVGDSGNFASYKMRIRV